MLSMTIDTGLGGAPQRAGASLVEGHVDTSASLVERTGGLNRERAQSSASAHL
jgi:hypothetical protein